VVCSASAYLGAACGDEDRSESGELDIGAHYEEEGSDTARSASLVSTPKAADSPSSVYEKSPCRDPADGELVQRQDDRLQCAGQETASLLIGRNGGGGVHSGKTPLDDINNGKSVIYINLNVQGFAQGSKYSCHID